MANCVARPPGHSIGRDPARAGNEIAALDVRGNAGESAVNMNEAFRRFPPLQSVDLPVASVVVPTFNERDNVTRLYGKRESSANLDFDRTNPIGL